MLPVHHCELCDHQQTSLQQGTTCALTNQKPNFHSSCSSIALNEKFENRLRKANVNYESIKRQRASVYSSSLVIIAIGVVVIITGYLYGKLTLEGGVISTVPLIVMAVGLTPIGLGFRKLVHYKQEFDDARRKKDKVDNVVKANNLLYDIDISFGKVIHGAQEVHAELKISGRR